MDDVAHALADPIRRTILRMLRDRALTAGEIAGAFDVTRPAVSRHLRVLREAGLVRDELQGRERYYHLALAALAALERFLAELHEGTASTWERRLMALETEVYRVRQQRSRKSAATPTPATGTSSKPKKETA